MKIATINITKKESRKLLENSGSENRNRNYEYNQKESRNFLENSGSGLPSSSSLFSFLWYSVSFLDF